MSMCLERQAFYHPQELAQSVEEKVKQVRERGEPIDYLAFVPDGEPTLDINLGKEIELLRPLGLRIAVISNASLIWRDDVRRELQKADWVSLKVDAVSTKIWRRVNRPAKPLKLEVILDAMLSFAYVFKGTLSTESMLIRGINDGVRATEALADFLARLEPDIAYLAIPTRPPALAAVTAPSDEALNMAFVTMSKKVGNVEYLTSYEGDAFASTGNVRDDLLSITAVHPMREEAVTEFLRRAGASWDVVKELIENQSLVELNYRGRKFYASRFPNLQRKGGPPG